MWLGLLIYFLIIFPKQGSSRACPTEGRKAVEDSSNEYDDEDNGDGDEGPPVKRGRVERRYRGWRVEEKA